jgi:glycosyltransferase involved in cell wall biosynthesis
MIRELRLTEHVEMRAIPADDQLAMAEHLSKVALVVLLSDYETQPLVVLEALALRRPVLIADIRGLEEFVERGLVRAIPSDSGPQEVAAAVLEQLRKPLIPPRLELPTWAECAARHDELYASIIRQTGSQAPADCADLRGG